MHLRAKTYSSNSVLTDMVADVFYDRDTLKIKLPIGVFTGKLNRRILGSIKWHWVLSAANSHRIFLRHDFNSLPVFNGQYEFSDSRKIDICFKTRIETKFPKWRSGHRILIAYENSGIYIGRITKAHEKRIYLRLDSGAGDSFNVNSKVTNKGGKIIGPGYRRKKKSAIHFQQLQEFLIGFNGRITFGY